MPRLRQAVLVAADLTATCDQIESELGLRDPFHDPGVAEFGLANAVYETGDTYLEVVSPVRDGTTAGRYLERRGGDAGYMAIFQVADTPATRARVESMGVRVVWTADLDDISATHLHPKDVPGAIVSFDTPRPPETWRWAGPRWTGASPVAGDRRGPGSLAALEVRLVDVDAGAATWAGILDESLSDGAIALDGGAQQVRFAAAGDASTEGIGVVEIDGLAGETTIAGVVFRGRSEQ